MSRLLTMAAKSNQSGMATIEAVALLVVFLLLLNYGMGFFGAIQTGILNSISARAYAWETFAHRTNLSYFRSRAPTPANRPYTHVANGYRTHTVISEQNPPGNSDIFYVTERGITRGRPSDAINRDPAGHQGLKDLPVGRAERQKTNPIWIKTAYGICLDSQCGGVTGRP